MNTINLTLQTIRRIARALENSTGPPQMGVGINGSMPKSDIKDCYKNENVSVLFIMFCRFLFYIIRIDSL